MIFQNHLLDFIEIYPEKFFSRIYFVYSIFIKVLM